MPHPATSDHVGPELSLLHRQACQLARQRNEALTTCHLLAALARSDGPVRDLLSERQVTADRLLDLAATLPERARSAVERSLADSVELSRRMGTGRPNSTHLLMAVLAEPSSAGRIGLERLNVDVTRLRSQAWNLGIGWASRKTTPQRAVVQGADPLAQPPRSAPDRRKIQAGVTIPLFPTPPKTGPRKRNASKAQSIPIMPEAPTKLPKKPVPPRQESPSAHEAQPAATAIPIEAQPPSKPRRTLDHFELDPKRFPILTQVGRNLTLEAARNQHEVVFGREREIDQALDVLAKCEGNSPCLVGPSGVGKTSVVRGLAQRIARRNSPTSVDDRIVIELPVNELLAGTGVRGALAQRIGALRKEVNLAAGRVVVFFDEIHVLFASDVADESAGDLKSALARGEFPCIGATTPEDFRRSIQADPTLARRFTAVEIEEPSREDAYRVLESVACKLAQHHQVRYSEEALTVGLNWSVRYLPDRMLPEKAIAIADLAGARAHRRGHQSVSPEQVAEVVASLAAVPVERLMETDASRMLVLERIVGERVVGHAASISRICNVLRRNAAGLGSERPIGTFLLLGPTGVGKTETAKALAHALFHTETAMTRLDMAEYSEAHAVARLIGAPPGYVGHDAGGQLTEAVRKRPYQVLLLDEIEKAHNDVLQAFLGVFDEGRMTDGRGRTVDFRNTIIIMTSNLGAEHTQGQIKRRVGFAGTDPDTTADASTLIIASARARLSPELYNRIDECMVYSALGKAEVEEIARRLVQRLAASLAARNIDLDISPAGLRLLVEQGGFDARLGARPMKRTIARFIEAPLAERILSGEACSGSKVTFDTKGDSLSMRVERQAPAG